MTTAWTLPAASIIADALEHIGVLGAGQTASGEDADKAMAALQNILKELPIHGVVFPKVTMPRTALLWDAAKPKEVAMPADYYGSPVISFGLAGGDKKLAVISRAAYEAIANPNATAEHPECIYIGPQNLGYLWPVPNVNPLLGISYQAVTSDATLSMTPDVAQTWIGGLGLWVAYEICPKFGVDMATRADIEKRFMMRRALMLAHATETAPICFTVAD